MTHSIPGPALPRDHGGNLDAAIARYGGTVADWIDLSTGINPWPYPMPPVAERAFHVLPSAGRLAALAAAAAAAFGTTAGVLPLAGASSAIQLVPRLDRPGQARILGPTYNEHRAALEAQGWSVADVPTLEALAGADLAVLVNPNNPDGQFHAPERVRALADRVGRLVIDESFVEVTPDLSLAAWLDEADDRIVVQRSFGKFYGLAGVRLGFVLGGHATRERLQDLAGPWSVSGPAIEAGLAALPDTAWANATRHRLAQSAERLDQMSATVGWALVGGTSLFRCYACPDAAAAQAHLAEARIWTRIFPWSQTWIRLGLPGSDAEESRLAEALATLPHPAPPSPSRSPYSI